MKRFSLQEVPHCPGVYVFRNSAGKVIYVGKAKSLKKRLASYFRPSRNRNGDPKLRSLVNSIAAFETIQVNSEAEALLLESRLIKEYQPFYNVDLRDDKRFLLIVVALDDPFPRLQLTRLKRNDGRLYFGPFPFTRALRQTVSFLADFLGLRKCAARICPGRPGKHCMSRHLKECVAPCTGTVTPEEYRAHVDHAIRILSGDVTGVEAALKQRMAAAVAARDFETAASLRDAFANLRAVCNPTRHFEHAYIRTPDLAVTSVAVQGLQAALGLSRLPLTIECFDISNISGQLAVGSMVSFVNGQPNRTGYRRFRIKTVTGADDFAMIREVVLRRYRRLLAEKGPQPDLVVIDGGAGHLRSAAQALLVVNLVLPVIALAKKQEEVYLPGRACALRLDRAEPALKLLQAVRDEAHRFGLGYHRLLRQKRLNESVLDEIPGIGPQRRAALLGRLGSVKRIAASTPEALAVAVPGLGLAAATRIIVALRAKESRVSRGVLR